MRFNSENNQWYIYTFTEGTYDAVRLYYPIQLDDTYKTDGQKVLFSGTYGARLRGWKFRRKIGNHLSSNSHLISKR